MDIKPRYSVIIRCHNEEEHIGRLLTGIFEQSVKPEEIVLVDSGSTDATLSIASRFSVKIATIKKEEFSFGRALNIGCSLAQSPFLIIASAHVYPSYKNWAELLLEPFKDERVGLTYGKQKGDESTRYSESCIWKKWFPDGSLNNQKHPFCNNANAAIPKALWKQVPYSEELTGLEDLDWAKKITEKGFTVVYQPSAEITHVHNESYGQIYDRYYREALALKKIYPEERLGKREFVCLLLSNISSDLLHAFNDKVIFKNFKDTVLFRLIQFSGSYRGFYDGGKVSTKLKERFYYPSREHYTSNGKGFGKEFKIDYSKVYDEGNK